MKFTSVFILFASLTICSVQIGNAQPRRSKANIDCENSAPVDMENILKAVKQISEAIKSNKLLKDMTQSVKCKTMTELKNKLGESNDVINKIISELISSQSKNSSESKLSSNGFEKIVENILTKFQRNYKGVDGLMEGLCGLINRTLNSFENKDEKDKKEVTPRTDDSFLSEYDDSDTDSDDERDDSDNKRDDSDDGRDDSDDKHDNTDDNRDDSDDKHDDDRDDSDNKHDDDRDDSDEKRNDSDDDRDNSEEKRNDSDDKRDDSDNKRDNSDNKRKDSDKKHNDSDNKQDDSDDKDDYFSDNEDDDWYKADKKQSGDNTNDNQHRNSDTNNDNKRHSSSLTSTSQKDQSKSQTNKHHRVKGQSKSDSLLASRQNSDSTKMLSNICGAKELGRIPVDLSVKMIKKLLKTKNLRNGSKIIIVEDNQQPILLGKVEDNAEFIHFVPYTAKNLTDVSKLDIKDVKTLKGCKLVCN